MCTAVLVLDLVALTTKKKKKKKKKKAKNYPLLRFLHQLQIIIVIIFSCPTAQVNLFLACSKTEEALTRPLIALGQLGPTKCHVFMELKKSDGPGHR